MPLWPLGVRKALERQATLEIKVWTQGVHVEEGSMVPVHISTHRMRE